MRDKLKIRYVVLIVLLSVVWATQLIPILGEKYNLPSIDIFNDNGTLSEAAGLYIGMDRFDVREQIEKDLAAAGL